MGLRRSIRPVGHTCEFNGVGERFRHAPWGIFGGVAGKRGRFLLQSPDGTRSELSPKTGRLELRPDQLLIIETPGAGGYGPPAERDGSDIEKDRRSGKFTTAYLQLHYKK
jgi:N-methylhydantoinase B